MPTTAELLEQLKPDQKAYQASSYTQSVQGVPPEDRVQPTAYSDYCQERYTSDKGLLFRRNATGQSRLERLLQEAIGYGRESGLVASSSSSATSTSAPS